MTTTSIEWTERTWNPVRGCSRVSPGCDNCYAMRQAHRFSGPGEPYDGLTTRRRGKTDWSGVARFVPEMLDAPLRVRKPTTWFVNSMSDLFHHSVTNEQIAAVFGVMAACPQHTFQVLTKRAERLPEWFGWLKDQAHEDSGEIEYRGTLSGAYADALGDGSESRRDDLFMAIWHSIDPTREDIRWPLPNVWLGVSCEDQRRADERVPHLLATPAAVRFVSAEPLLGPVDLRRYFGLRCEGCGSHGAGVAWCRLGSGYGDGHIEGPDSACGPMTRDSSTPRIDWVIVGGESGNGARPCNVEWIRSIVAQCSASGVACFIKQLGRFSYADKGGRDFPSGLNLKNRKGGDPSEWPEDLRVREFPR